MPKKINPKSIKDPLVTSTALLPNNDPPADCNTLQSDNTDYDQVSDTPKYHKWLPKEPAEVISERQQMKRSFANPVFVGEQFSMNKLKHTYLKEIHSLKQELKRQAKVNACPSASSSSSSSLSLEEQLEICHNRLAELQKKIQTKELSEKEKASGTYIRDVNLLKLYSNNITTQENMWKIFEKAKVPQFWIIGIEIDPRSEIKQNNTVNDTATLLANTTLNKTAPANKKTKKTSLEQPLKHYSAVYVLFFNDYVKKQAVQMLNEFLSKINGEKMQLEECVCISI